jgi:hypothetical protein
MANQAFSKKISSRICNSSGNPKQIEDGVKAKFYKDTRLIFFTDENGQPLYLDKEAKYFVNCIKNEQDFYEVMSFLALVCNLMTIHDITLHQSAVGVIFVKALLPLA